MIEFLQLHPPDEALTLFLRALPDHEPVSELMDTIEALGRVTAESVRAPHSLPAFNRSAMDGYAVRAADTFGASESLPGYLSLVGVVAMGAVPGFVIKPGEAALIHTGGMLPEGADSVIMLEYTQSFRRGGLRVDNEKTSSGKDEIEVLHAIAVGENILHIGEDVTQGQIVLPAGRRIRPAEIGGLMALGIMRLRVAKKPKIGILSTGDELLQPLLDPQPGQVRDINTYTLSSLVTQAGGEPVLVGILPDDLEKLRSIAKKTLAGCDLVLITAGSSASARDMTAEAICSLGKPGILVHGVNIRPGKPTILAVCDGKAVIGLPGNPVSALVIASLFVVPVIDKLLGLTAVLPRPTLKARLTLNIPSQAGREEWVAVRLLLPPPDYMSKIRDNINLVAEPIFSKSNLIFSLAAADGLVKIPADVTGISAGEMVEVVMM